MRLSTLLIGTIIYTTEEIRTGGDNEDFLRHFERKEEFDVVGYVDYNGVVQPKDAFEAIDCSNEYIGVWSNYNREQVGDGSNNLFNIKNKIGYKRLKLMDFFKGGFTLDNIPDSKVNPFFPGGSGGQHANYVERYDSHTFGSHFQSTDFYRNEKIKDPTGASIFDKGIEISITNTSAAARVIKKIYMEYQPKLTSSYYYLYLDPEDFTEKFYTMLCKAFLIKISGYNGYGISESYKLKTLEPVINNDFSNRKNILFSNTSLYGGDATSHGCCVKNETGRDIRLIGKPYGDIYNTLGSSVILSNNYLRYDGILWYDDAGNLLGLTSNSYPTSSKSPFAPNYTYPLRIYHYDKYGDIKQNSSSITRLTSIRISNIKGGLTETDIADFKNSTFYSNIKNHFSISEDDFVFTSFSALSGKILYDFVFEDGDIIIVGPYGPTFSCGFTNIIDYNPFFLNKIISKYSYCKKLNT